MRKIVILLATGVALLGAGYAFEANATMGVAVEGLKRQSDSFSPVEKADCTGPGMFCPKGAALQCDPLCICVSCAQHANPHKHHKA